MTSLVRQDPNDQLPGFSGGDLRISGHGYRTPGTCSAFDDFLCEFVRRVRLPRVLCGNRFERGTDPAFSSMVTTHAVFLVRQSRISLNRRSGQHGEQ